MEKTRKPDYTAINKMLDLIQTDTSDMNEQEIQHFMMNCEVFGGQAAAFSLILQKINEFPWFLLKEKATQPTAQEMKNYTAEFRNRLFESLNALRRFLNWLTDNIHKDYYIEFNVTKSCSWGGGSFHIVEASREDVAVIIYDRTKSNPLLGGNPYQPPKSAPVIRKFELGEEFITLIQALESVPTQRFKR